MGNENIESLEKILIYLHKIEYLKSTLRHNKTTSGRRESSADHSWRLALFALIVADELKIDVDVNRTIKIALVHDLAEAITGDIDAILIAEGKFSKEEKEKQEIAAMIELRETLPNSIGREIHDLWHEYNDCVTKEAKFIKALDKLEAIIQLIDSGHETYDKPGFIPNYANKAVGKVPELKGILRIMKKKLKLEFEKGGFEWKSEYDSLEKV